MTRRASDSTTGSLAAVSWVWSGSAVPVRGRRYRRQSRPRALGTARTCSAPPDCHHAAMDDRRPALAPTDPWPALPLAAWQDTRDTLHRWTQVVGKVRLALAPAANHWWHVPFYVDSVGLTTSLMPYRGIGVEIVFDLTAHELLLRTTTGGRRRLALEPRSVADFTAEFRSALTELGLDVPIHPVPVELPDAVPFDE